MAFVDDLRKKVREIFRTKWQVRDGKVIPEPEDVQLGKDAVQINGTVLYADLADSTDMVTSKKPQFAADVYKAYLDSTCRVIRENGGVITAFDGDRVMAVFIGKAKNSCAVRAAFNINWAVRIVNEELKNNKWTTDFAVRHCVGIDTGKLWVAKTGIRGTNDLVWVGRAANYAAKLCAERDGNYVSWITADVYKSMNRSVKITKRCGDSVNMWKSEIWHEYDVSVYKSNWWWKVGAPK